MTLNGQTITPTFHWDESAQIYTGLVTGLKLGPNALAVFTNGIGAGRAAASLTVTNHSLTGPIISGPRQQPFICQTQSFALPVGGTLGPARDADCSVPTRINYVYRPDSGGPLKPLPSTTRLPADVGKTTTDQGVTVPFVVRVETGTMDRGIYQNAVLHDPTTEPAPTPFTPPKGWNRRFQGLQGSSCIGG